VGPGRLIRLAGRRSGADSVVSIIGADDGGDEGQAGPVDAGPFREPGGQVTLVFKPVEMPAGRRERVRLRVHVSVGGMYSRAMASTRTASLDVLIEQATVDAYNDDEQLTGLFTMIEEHLGAPSGSMPIVAGAVG
jgi:hypothetical protein